VANAVVLPANAVPLLLKSNNYMLSTRQFSSLFLGLLFASLSFCINAQVPTPAGSWLTIDDETNTPRSIVKIWIDHNELKGKITQIYFREGEKETDVCDKCTDIEHKDKTILGMTILWGMEQKTNRQWHKGYILDPHNGKIYHAQITLSPNNKQLIVRGYVGLPLIGRSQTWTRVDE
jgi:uncharacterized protein (DUF2147 family)